MHRIFFTADLHLGHPHMAERLGFDDVDTMNQIILCNINEKVQPNDELWILGDFSYKISKDEARELLHQIRCRTVHLINGNHDKHWDVSDGWNSVNDYTELRGPDIPGRIPLFHYPIQTWNGRWKGYFHFFGHIHGTEEMNVKNAVRGIRSYDVGIQANGMFPISLTEIVERITTVEDLLKDGYTVNDLRSETGELVFPGGHIHGR